MTTDQVIDGWDCGFSCHVKILHGQVVVITMRPRTKIRVTAIQIQNSGRWEIRAMRICNRKVTLPRASCVHEVSPWDDYVMEVAYVGLDPRGETFHARLVGSRVEASEP